MLESPTSLEEYLLLIEILRDERRRPEWTVDDDDPFLARMMELHDLLTEDEQEHVNTLGWRTVPEKYDERVKLIIGYDELAGDDAIATQTTARGRAA